MERIVPQNTQQLYAMLLSTSNLCGKIELINNNINWYLYKNYKITINIDVNEGFISIDKMGVKGFLIPFTHWHPTKEEIYDELCSIGSKDSILVIRNSLFGKELYYLGRLKEYKLPLDKKWHWGKLQCLRPEQ